MLRTRAERRAGPVNDEAYERACTDLARSITGLHREYAAPRVLARREARDLERRLFAAARAARLLARWRG